MPDTDFEVLDLEVVDPEVVDLEVVDLEVDLVAFLAVLDAGAWRAAGLRGAAFLTLRAAAWPRFAAGSLRPFAAFVDVRAGAARLRPPGFVRVVFAMTASWSNAPIIGAFPMPGNPTKGVADGRYRLIMHSAAMG